MYRPMTSAASSSNLRIIACHVTLKPVWFHPRLAPDPLYRRLAEPERCRQFPTGPVRTAIHRRLGGLVEYFGLHGGCNGSRLTPVMLCFQSRHPVLLEPRFPSRDRRTRGVQFPLDLCVALASGQSQNQQRDGHIPRSQSADRAQRVNSSRSVSANCRNFHSLPYRARRLEMSDGYSFTGTAH